MAQYQVIVAPEAEAGLNVLPKRIAAAAVNFMWTHLQQHPHEAGIELRGPQLKGLLLAQRGQYRIVYTINDAEGIVSVLQILPQH